MEPASPGEPAGLVGGESLEFRIEGSRAVLELEERLYPLEAIYGAAYLFLDRCHVFLADAGLGRVRVTLRYHEPPRDAVLDELAGEFSNELLNQILRQRLAQSTSRVRELYTARALGLVEGRSKIDQLLEELEAEEWGDDPLAIATPWEEQRQRTGSPGAAPREGAEPQPGSGEEQP